jgi:hypothetical protein
MVTQHPRNPEMFVAMYRSSQPGVGILDTTSWQFGKRSLEDEYYLQVIGNPNCPPYETYQAFTGIATNGNDQSQHDQFKLVWGEKNLNVFDLRPKSTAEANRWKNGGFEMNNRYHNMVYDNCNMDNIHTVTDTYKAMSLVACYWDTKEFTRKISDSLWYYHISIALKTTMDCRRALSNGQSILIHCSDGWDRTAVISGLVQLISKPQYRTIEGFCQLIEKDFITAGFQVALRANQITNDKDSHKTNQSEMSPIFIFFMDCVQQVWHQHVTEFEFNMDL